jgi:hypothetical protein
MKPICALAFALVVQTSAAPAQPLQQSPNIRQQERPIAPIPTVRTRVYAPAPSCGPATRRTGIASSDLGASQRYSHPASADR